MNQNWWVIQSIVEAKEAEVRRETEIRRRMAEAKPQRNESLKVTVGKKLIMWGERLAGSQDCT
jgi:hypothetical protein